MDIHPPDAPVHSFRSFMVHIAIVTVGILIALSLEGIEESVHNRHVVREAHENFREELKGNRYNMDRELINNRNTLAQLNSIIAELPQLRQHPAQLAQRVAEIKPSGYFFSSSRWESALSTGALGHMSVEEVNRYGEANFLVHTYTALESKASPDWTQLEAFFSAHENLTPTELDTGIEKIFIYLGDAKGLDQVSKELSQSIDRAQGKPQ